MALIASCKEAKETAPMGSGYTLDSSANIDYAKKTLISCAKGDLDTYRSLYADTAIFYG